MEEGADVESRDGHQGTALHRLAAVGRDEAVNGVLAKNVSTMLTLSLVRISADIK